MFNWCLVVFTSCRRRRGLSRVGRSRRGRRAGQQDRAAEATGPGGRRSQRGPAAVPAIPRTRADPSRRQSLGRTARAGLTTDRAGWSLGRPRRAVRRQPVVIQRRVPRGSRSFPPLSPLDTSKPLRFPHRHLTHHPSETPDPSDPLDALSPHDGPHAG